MNRLVCVAICVTIVYNSAKHSKIRKVVSDMAVKTANVNSRMELNIKQQAESILDRLGIPRSVAIDMYYRQIIAHNGIPFSLTLPSTVPARNEMSVAEYNRMMATGLSQAKADDSFDVDEVFGELEEGMG